MSRLRDLAERAYDASRLWKIKLFVQYDIPRYQTTAARAIVARFPAAQSAIEAYFRGVRGYVACLGCGHTWATCGFREVDYHHGWDVRGGVRTIPGDLFVHGAWFACYCCWDRLTPDERRALARRSREADRISAAEAWDEIDAGCDEDGPGRPWVLTED